MNPEKSMQRLGWYKARSTQLIEKRAIVLVLLLLCVISAIAAPAFLSFHNLSNIFLQASVLAVAACGVTFVVLNGGIDFSSVTVISLSSVIGAKIMSADSGLLANSVFALPAAMAAMLIVGLVIGAINGFSVVVLKMPSFIVTLATMMMGGGIAVWFTQGNTIYNLPASFNFIGSGKLLTVPVPVCIAAAVIIIAHFVLSKTLFGRQVYSVGTNARTSFISGIPVGKTIFKLFLISGLLSAIAGIVLTARMESGASGYGSLSMFIDIIGGIIIGGTSIFGGRGTVVGTLFGVLFITVMNNSLDLMGVPWFTINIIKGTIILIAAFSDSIRFRKGS